LAAAVRDAVAIRDAAEGDEEFILALNAACTPAVGALDANGLAALRGWARRVLVAEAGGARVGFIILLGPGTAYDSDNYAWFEQRFPSHLYIDRVAVDAAARGANVGRMLYDAAAKIARDLGEERLTAEVNEQPPNPESMAFHERMGFNHLVSRASRAGKVVAMLERPL
jgi:predicted GNAT superfamily acetyltransferase